MASETSKYTRKHEMLQEFQARKKNHFITVLLLFLFGGFGAHRFYLGNKIIGYLILGCWVLIMLSVFTGVQTNRAMFLGLIWLVFIIIEYIIIIKVIDNRNSKLRKELEKKHGLDTFG